MKKLLALFVLSFLSFTTGCDIIDAPYRKEIEKKPIEKSDSTNRFRTVLLEKFTGSNCGPCPEVNTIAQSVYKDFIRVNVISYHAGGLARPDPASGLVYDFRTSQGTAIGMDLLDGSTPLNINTPTVVMDRLNYGTSSSIPVPKSLIITEVSKRIDILSPISLTIYPWYNPDNRTVEVSGNVIFYEAVDKDMLLTIALVENDFVKPQKKADGKIDSNYVHQFVFRTNIPDFAWGSEVSPNDVPVGSIIPYNRTFQLPANVDWNPAKFTAVAYVYRNTDAPILTREVLQSSSKQVSIVP
ncbi:MAG: Omp28-related outer membrane protein [Candidatus Kapabacteria bacterium]|nr:Omp28-related outer membrane protein [Candidatus Kapabacteria bacterium]